MYKLSGVTKNYAKGRETVAALRGVDLVIEDGEWLAIQGPTGHGKSTLLQVLGGLGLAQLREAEVTRVRATDIGFVFQTFNLIPTLSAQENVEAALVPLHVPAGARRQRAAAALETVGLADRLRHVPANCPAASGSGSPSPAPWSRSPRSCWPTNRPATSTRTRETRSSACLRPCAGNVA
jgi:putative ABC transport system ATP-binding protein